MFRPGLISTRAALTGMPICQIGSALDFLAASEEPFSFKGGGRRASRPSER